MSTIREVSTLERRFSGYILLVTILVTTGIITVAHTDKSSSSPVFAYASVETSSGVTYPQTVFISPDENWLVQALPGDRVTAELSKLREFDSPDGSMHVSIRSHDDHGDRYENVYLRDNRLDIEKSIWTTPESNWTIFGASWSPDSQYLVILEGDIGNSSEYIIFSMDGARKVGDSLSFPEGKWITQDDFSQQLEAAKTELHK